jgi:uncharacterized protein YbjT (DUF2867 family)
MKTKDKVLVYGAGGVQGGAVARKLLNEGYTVHTIVRSLDKAAELQKQGITAFVGDLSDADGLTSAHDGVSKVFLLLPVEYDQERNRQFIRNTVDAAKHANVKLLVINTSGFVPDDAAAYGVYALNHPELAGQILPIVGPEALTGNQLAEQFNAALDREIQFYSLPVDAFEGAMAPILGKEPAAGLADSYKWVGLNAKLLPKPDQVIDELRSAAPGTPLIEWVKQAVKQGFFAPASE